MNAFCLLFSSFLTFNPLTLSTTSPEAIIPTFPTVSTSSNESRSQTHLIPASFPASHCTLSQHQLLSEVGFSFQPVAFETAPQSNAQLYQQRLSALTAGELYTQLNPDSFYEQWEKASQQPTYQQWKHLLALEAQALTKSQGRNRLGVLVGDSLSMWFPSSLLPQGQFWLNQGISGENSRQILQRIETLHDINANTIYIMAGVNDLRQGATDQTILQNIRLTIHRLKQDHDKAEIIIQSILPTRWERLPHSRIHNLNQKIALIAQQEEVHYLNLYPLFVNAQGKMHDNLTTDGLHLNAQGYLVWQDAVKKVETWMMFNHRTF